MGDVRIAGRIRSPRLTPFKYLGRRVGLTRREPSIAVGDSDAMIRRLAQNQRRPNPATLQARFIPALDLQDEPPLVQRLLELAAAVRREDALETALPLFNRAVRPHAR